MTDIDIDFADRTKILEIVRNVPATIASADGSSKRHNTGIYCHQIPINPITGTASIDYKEAEKRGYMKLDFLNVSIYQGIKDEDHLVRLLSQEPIWDLLLEDDFTDQVFHVNGHGEILRKMKPRSIEELAMVLAMIRPAKRHLIGKSWDEIRKEIWTKPISDEYYYKKSHSIAYAAAVVVHMNLLCEELTSR